MELHNREEVLSVLQSFPYWQLTAYDKQGWRQLFPSLLLSGPSQTQPPLFWRKLVGARGCVPGEHHLASYWLIPQGKRAPPWSSSLCRLALQESAPTRRRRWQCNGWSHDAVCFPELFFWAMWHQLLSFRTFKQQMWEYILIPNKDQWRHLYEYEQWRCWC